MPATTFEHGWRLDGIAGLRARAAAAVVALERRNRAIRHALLQYVPWPVRSSPSRTSPRAVPQETIAGASRRDSRGMRGCSTSMSIPTTTARCSRSAGSESELVDALVDGIACRTRPHRPSSARGRASACRSGGRGSGRGRRGPNSSRQAKRAALALADRVGTALGLPVFLYGELAPGVRPALLRRGGPDELQRRIDVGEVVPDRGPARLDPRQAASSSVRGGR